MLRFQFYTSQDVITHVELDTPLTDELTSQLLEKGFTTSGEVISAPTILKAMKQHQDTYKGGLDKYATAGIVLGHYS